MWEEQLLCCALLRWTPSCAPHLVANQNYNKANRVMKGGRACDCACAIAHASVFLREPFVRLGQSCPSYFLRRFARASSCAQWWHSFGAFHVSVLEKCCFLVFAGYYQCCQRVAYLRFSWFASVHQVVHNDGTGLERSMCLRWICGAVLFSLDIINVVSLFRICDLAASVLILLAVLVLRSKCHSDTNWSAQFPQ